MKIQNQKWLWGLLLVVLIVLAYGNIINNDFLSDDYDWIRESRIHVESGEWSNAFTEKIGGNFYRPLAFFSFQIDYSLFGYNASGYYMHQLLIFALLVAGVYVLMYQLFKERLLAFTTAVFFLLWPAHHEVVTWLAGRPDLYAAMFGVWASLFFLKAIESKRLYYWGYFFISLILFAASILSKESTFILPGLLSIMVAITVLSAKEKKKLAIKGILTLIGFIIPLGIVLYERGKVLTDSLGGYLIGQQQILLDIPVENITRPFRSISYVLNWPYTLNRFSDISLFEIIYKVFIYVEQYLYIVLFIGAAWLIWMAIKRKKIENVSVYIFSLLWIVISFIPVYGVSNVINHGLGNSRFFFFASIGFALLIAWVVTSGGKLFSRRVQVMGIILVGFSMLLLLKFNAVPWESASRSVSEVKQAFIFQQEELIAENDNHLIVTNLPRRIFDAYIFYRENSIQEALYETGVQVESIHDYGSSKPWPGPFCGYTEGDNIAVVTWVPETQSFMKMNIKDSTAMYQGLVVEKGIQRQWDFTKEDDASAWEYQGEFTWSENGTEIVITSPSDYMEFIFYEPAALSQFTHMKIEFDIQEEISASAYRTHILWTDDEKYDREDAIRYPLSGVVKVNKKIPLCPYTSWMSSVNIRKFRITPISQGEILLKSITLISE